MVKFYLGKFYFIFFISDHYTVRNDFNLLFKTKLKEMKLMSIIENRRNISTI